MLYNREFQVPILLSVFWLILIAVFVYRIYIKKENRQAGNMEKDEYYEILRYGIVVLPAFILLQLTSLLNYTVFIEGSSLKSSILNTYIQMLIRGIIIVQSIISIFVNRVKKKRSIF
ncbi:MAG: hypothetical protein Q4D65_01135 [Peptostreptococcaceae bacterium]|nr:hypothetical protein [Peptostreptococcaceae bacterium]